MRDRRLDGPTDASALDREIERALAVEPSAEFVARVRTRIAADPAPRMDVGLVRWLLMGGASVAAVTGLVAAYVGLNPPRNALSSGGPGAVVRVEPAERPGMQDPVATRAPAVEVAGRAETGNRDAHARDAVERAGAARSSARRHAEPDAFADVMVSASEVAGFRQMLAMAQAGIEIVEGSRAPSAAEPMADVVIEPITIEPIRIEPIALVGMEGVAE
jgi:hypothetical protein